MSRPAVSVVVSTYQRSAKLGALVSALSDQTLPAEDFEVLIVDDGSTDGSWEVLQELAVDTPFELRPIRLEVNGGPAGGRNAGWRAASAPIIAFTDDDCVPTVDWLSSGLRAMQVEGRFVVGRTTPNPAQAAHRGPFSRTMEVLDNTFMQTCNIFYFRRDLEEVGGFDARSIRAKGGEDTDLGWRLCDLGREAVFDADVHVLHDISASSFVAALREATAFVDIPRVKVVHPKRTKARLYGGIFWKQSHALALVATAGLIATAVLRRPGALVIALPWAQYRFRRAPLGEGREQRLALLPCAFLIDLVEISTMVRGSIRHRTLML